MNVTIIGAGNMGRGIGTRLAAAGHSITYLDHHTENSQKAAEQVRKSAAKGADVLASGMEEKNLGDVVILALWYGTNVEVARQLGQRLAGKVVVDIANPANASYSGLVTPADSSSAQEVAQAVDSNARVVKAFNTT